MSGSCKTTCPKCGGPATWYADDNITYCDDAKKNKDGKSVCGHFDVEPHNQGYKPPNYRGGV